MSKPVVKTTDDQQQASDPKLSVWVSANAGSGKTHVLVERVTRLLLSGVEPASILCITYTKAAAAEMWSRLFTNLAAWTNLDDAALTLSLQQLGEDGTDPVLQTRARQLFTKALETPGGLKIQTIHAFCEKLLHLFPVEAGLAPGFSVMDERRELELQSSATQIVLNKAEHETESQTAKAFEALTDRLNKDDFQSLIKSFITALRKASPELLNLEKASYELVLSNGLAVTHLNFEVIKTELNSIDKAAYLHHAKLLELSGKHWRVNPSEAMMKIAQADEPEDLLEKFFLTDGAARKQFLRDEISEALPETQSFIDTEKLRVFELIQQRNTLEIIAQSGNAFVLAKDILQHISVEKQRLGIYDFADLITKAASLLSNARATQWVLKKLDEGLNHILLDEAQDTSPDQWRIVRRLADEFFAGAGLPKAQSRSVFVVGDQKQSIFSFQGADAKGFAKTREELFKQTQGQMALVELTTSYRSTSTVLDAVNQLFTQTKLKELGIFDASERDHTGVRKDQGVVELWPFETEEKIAEPDAWARPLDTPAATSADRLLAETIAEKIAGWLSPTRPKLLMSKNRPVQPGDILILFQTRSTLYRLVLAHLRQHGVPVAGADRLILLNSLIVQDIVVLLGWLLLPQDDHALAIILKSPLVPEPLSEKQLFELCYNRKANLVDLISGPNQNYLNMLQQQAHTAGPFQVLSLIILKSRQSIAKRLGEEALEASAAMMDLALDYEADHGLSLFGFINWFSATETTLKRDMDKAKGDVRLMTVHGAKGLEAEIVIMADATYVKKLSRSGPTVTTLPENERAAGLPIWKMSGKGPHVQQFENWIDLHTQDIAQENSRLLYVAMTRARDELYICGAKGKNKVGERSWWPTITQALGAPENDEPQRFGLPDQFIDVTKTNIPPAAHQAPWLLRNPKLEGQKPREAFNPSGNRQTLNPEAAKRGTALHRLLQDIANVSEDRRFSVARQRAIALDLTEADAKQMANLMARPDLHVYFGQGSKSEADIIGTLPNGMEVSGRIDRLTVLPEGIWLLDYKSNQGGSEPISPSHPYVKQLATYAALLGQLYPTSPIHAALLWTQTGEHQHLPEALITAALQEIELSKA